MDLDWQRWFPWGKKEEPENGSLEKTPTQETQARLIYAFGGNATLGSVLTRQAVENSQKVLSNFREACLCGERMFGLPSIDPLKAIDANSPPYMQCAFSALAFGAYTVARKEHGPPDLHTGLSIGNICGYIASRGLDPVQASEKFFWRGFVMQESVHMAGMHGPPYSNITAIEIGDEGGHEKADEIAKILREEFGDVIGVAIYRHNAVMISHLGDHVRYHLDRFGKPKPFNEMGYHLPLVLQTAGVKWRQLLEPLCCGPAPTDLFWSGMRGNCTKIRPNNRARVDAICKEIYTPFGWDMLNSPLC